MEGLAAVIFVVVLAVVYLALFGVAITFYILQAIGQMKMAESCGIPNGWLAFLPFTNVYLMGRIAEKNTPHGRKPAPWRHLLLIGYIVFILLYIGYMVSFTVQYIDILAHNEAFSPYDLMEAVSGAVGFVGLYSVASIAYTALLYIVLYKIYALFSPKNAVLFLILSIFVSAAPILFFILRNRKPQLPDAPDPDAWK